MSRSTLRHRKSRPSVQPSSPPPSPSFPRYPLLLLLLPALFLFLHLLPYLLSPSLPPSLPPLPLSTAPDDESVLSLHSFATPPSPLPSPSILVCIPSVTRPNSTDYLSNTLKSLSLFLHSLSFHAHIFLLDYPSPSPPYLQNLQPLPNWISIHTRKTAPRKYTQVTLGDSEDRVKWRSKEALDYALVLETCSEKASALRHEVMLVVQDDVVFTPAFGNVLEWAKPAFAEVETIKRGKRRVIRVCSASLFDFGPGKDKSKLKSSNLVARVWKLAHVTKLVEHIKQRYDQMPVDWLVDKWCGTKISVVMHPNAVRHRGKVGSFQGNNRESLLT